MEKLSISQASKKFGISRARLYQLLNKGAIVGHKSMQRGPNAGSWVDSQSLSTHIENRLEKQRLGGMQPYGRPLATPEGDYLPARIAAKKTGYTRQYINQLARQGDIISKKIKGSILVCYPNLLQYMAK